MIPTSGGGSGQVQAEWIAPASALLIGYLLGAVPFGLLLTWAAGAGDLRAVGSGNIGATNVLRTGRKGLAAATLVLDALKGAAAVLIAARIGSELALLGGTAAFVGHCYPIWLRFRGGKGIATYLGVALAVAWPVGLVFAAVWAAVFAAFRYSSLAGILAAISGPVTAAARGDFTVAIMLLGFMLIVVWKHRANVERLFAGEEPRVGRAR